MGRFAAALAGAAVSLLVASTPALGQDPVEQQLWQDAADESRLTLIKPAPAGFVLDRITVRSPACDGHANALVSAVFRRADGAVIATSQFDGFCGQLGDTVIEEVVIRGQLGVVAEFGTGACFTAPDAAPCVVNSFGQRPDGRSIFVTLNGVELQIGSNLAGAEPLLAAAEAGTVVAPTPGLPPLFERFRGRVVKALTADAVRVRVNGRVRVVRLAGVRSPRGRQCWAPDARKLAGRLMVGRTLWFEDDPRSGKRFWAFRDYRGGGNLPYRAPLNGTLVNAGAAKRAPGEWRHALAINQQPARSAKRGLWGGRCRGSFTPRPVVKTPTPVAPARPVAPSRPARTDIYNCDDFPLADGTTAQRYLDLYRDDPSGLDGNNDGIACE